MNYVLWIFTTSLMNVKRVVKREGIVVSARAIAQPLCRTRVVVMLHGAVLALPLRIKKIVHGVCLVTRGAARTVSSCLSRQRGNGGAASATTYTTTIICYP